MPRLPDSPQDRANRNELLRRIGVRFVTAAVPTVLVGALAVALGVPVWVVVAVCVVILGLVLFEA